MQNLLISILSLLLFGALIFFFFKQKEKGRLLQSLDMVLFLVMMPKYEFKREELVQKREKELIAQMEQIYSNFLYLKQSGFFQRIIRGSPRIALEIASQIGEKDISFYVAVPTYLESNFEKYIQGVYPRALVEKVPQDYTIFEPKGETAGCYLRLREVDYLPINTYQNLEKDPLSQITNALSKILPQEGAAIQLIIEPVENKRWKRLGNEILYKLREGKSLNATIGEIFQLPAIKIIDGIIKGVFGSAKSKSEPEKKEVKIDEKAVQAIQSKLQKEVFQTNIRLVSSAQDRERAEQILNDLKAGFSQFSLFSMNGFQAVEAKKRRLRKLIYDFSFRNFDPSQKNILNLEELTSIYHFPTRYLETPYIKSAKTGAVAPPPELPEEGVNLIGKVIFRGEEKKVSFAIRDDRRRHFYIIGQTGTGKTTLLREMIRQDIQKGEGVGVIDPHGELIEATIANIPKERSDDLVLFEPFDLERPMGLNMLEYDTPEQKDFAIQEMIAIFHKLFPPEIIGPMFEHYMRNAMLVLMADRMNPGTLVEIPRIFTDHQFMRRKLEKVTDPMVRDFWLREWEQTTGRTKSEMLGYVISKVGRFVENEMMRNIIGQSHSSFDFSNIIDGKKIFLANLSKGLTGEVNSSLLGLILVSKIQMAAMKRVKTPESERKDFYLYIDEFQNFTTESIATILSEARKYRLDLILAHQYIPQLKSEIRNAVFGNVGAIGAFRVGATDAEFLEKQFEPEFSRFDLVNLDNFNLVIKMLIRGKVSTPFKVETFPPTKGNPDIVEPLKKLSKLRYGRPRDLVEAEILKRSRI